MSALRILWMALALLLATVAPLRAQAADPAGAHERALECYQRGEYERARELWLALADEQGEAALDRAELLYNLGNSAFRARKPLEAAGWYTACLRLSPRNADAWHNLEFVRREAGLEPADRGDLRATGVRLLGALTLAESERLVLALATLLAVALAWEALRGGTAARALAWTLTGLLGVALLPWGWQLARSGEPAVFVVQPEGAALLSEPRADAALIGRIPAANEALRIDMLPGWVRVTRGDGQPGWIESSSCVPLTAPYR